MKRLFLLCIVAMLFAACTKQPLPQASYDIIPQPKEVQLTEEKPFELNSKTVVYYEAGLQREAKFLSEYVNEIMGCALNIQEMQGNETKGIVLQLAQGASIDCDGLIHPAPEDDPLGQLGWGAGLIPFFPHNDGARNMMGA